MKNLGHFDLKAVELFEANFSENLEFSEDTENYDFARCQRPDGSFYGTSGQCRKGKESGAKEVKKPTTEKGKKISAARERNAFNKALGEMQRAAMQPKPKKLKTDFRKDVEKRAAKRKEADAKREARRTRDNELRGAVREKMVAHKAAKSELTKAGNDVDSAARKAKRDPSKENKEALKAQLRNLREKERAAAKIERELDKMGRERLRIDKQNKLERMTPAQRAEERRINKVIKERG